MHTIGASVILEANGFDWDKGNRAKCEKDGLSVDAIEALFASAGRSPGRGALAAGKATSSDRTNGERARRVHHIHASAHGR